MTILTAIAATAVVLAFCAWIDGRAENLHFIRTIGANTVLKAMHERSLRDPFYKTSNLHASFVYENPDLCASYVRSQAKWYQLATLPELALRCRCVAKHVLFAHVYGGTFRRTVTGRVSCSHPITLP